MGPRYSNALRKEDENMETTATRLPEVASQIGNTTLPKNGSGLEITAIHKPSVVQLVMHGVFTYLRQGRNLGPISVLLIVLIYSLLSPHLPAPIHDYIYHITR
jgi:hypothetical protein